MPEPRTVLDIGGAQEMFVGGREGRTESRGWREGREGGRREGGRRQRMKGLFLDGLLWFSV